MIEPITINVRYLARDIGLPHEQVQAVVTLFDDGFPVPFIARYRKDQTGNLDENGLRLIEEVLKSTRALCERKVTILKTIESLGKLTPELEKTIRDARTTKKLEDLYLPFKPKKQTLAATARERGLEPLALEILEATVTPENLDGRAAEFINEDKKIKTGADALLGAGHIIAEMFSERIELIQPVRDSVYRYGKLTASRIEPKPVESGETLPTETPSAEVNVEVNKETPVAETAVIELPPDEPPAERNHVAETEPVAENGEIDTAAADEKPADELSDEEAIKKDFDSWKAAQEEKGLPVVRSQNQIKKKTKKERRKEEIRKQKEESKAKQHERFEQQFADYFNYRASFRSLSAHRVLAVNRGERLKVLKVKIENDEGKLLESVQSTVVPLDHAHAEFLKGCLKDSLKRIVVPMIEREIRNELTENAARQSVTIFSKNLRSLLLQQPLYKKRVLALDPGFKNGCKMAGLDEFGNVIGFETVYLVGTVTNERKNKAMNIVADAVEKYKISVIAIGNGTGCRETERFIAQMIAERFQNTELAYIIVNEAGASVYSASPIAKEEFPHYDPLVRGAVSIGRRVQDSLNELVKIDPASLGVGMYQHDLKGKVLKETLGQVVESCVNHVGVDVNMATPAILRYVAGLNQLTAKRIYEYRRDKGPFRCREDLKNISGFGAVTFLLSAGFLRINGGSNPLDATSIHPENYAAASKILEKLGFTAGDLCSPEKLGEIREKIKTVNVEELANELTIGVFTVRDILDDLTKPGRDPRETLPPPDFRKNVLKLEDLQVGMELTGTILNVVDFGAFVDIGLHDSGLIHISQMSDQYIRNAHEKVSVGNVVRVWVNEIDPARKRISLSMFPPGTPKRPRPDFRRERNERPKQQEGEAGTEQQRPPRKPRREQRENATSHTPTASTSDRPGRGDAQPRPEGERRDDRPPRRDSRPHRDDRDRGDRRNRGERGERSPKVFVAAPKDKPVKALSEGMKTGKEPLRSFGDLAMLLGRGQQDDKD